MIIRIADRKRHVHIAIETFEDARLSYRARGVLAWLLVKPDGWRVDSEVIAAQGPEGRDAIRTALKELEAVGFLRRIKEQQPSGRWVTHTYVFESPTTDFQASVFQASENQALITNKTRANNHDYDADFERFWSAYPRSVGKLPAFRAWKKLNAEEREAVFLGLSVWIEYWKRKGKDEEHIPHASTWLNKHYWEEPPEKPKPKVHYRDKNEEFLASQQWRVIHGGG